MADTNAEIDIAERLRPFTRKQLHEKSPYFNSLRTFEEGFDRAQGLLRTIASAWLLVALAALGTVIANDAACLADLSADGSAMDQTAGSPEGCRFPFGSVARSLILLAAALGITSLWYLDQRVYQSLLHSVFVLGLKLEQLDHQLPPIRTVLKRLNRDITVALSWFYRAPFLVLMVLQVVNAAVFGLLLHDPARRSFGEAVADWELFLLILLLLAAILIQAIILVGVRKWPSLQPFEDEVDRLHFPPAPSSQPVEEPEPQPRM